MATHFYDLRTVADLADGARAIPEPGATYRLRTANNSRVEAGTVIDVVRRGETLFARTTAGDEFAVTGTGAHVLVPDGL
ncbi:MAG: hypothetical protein ACO1RT_02890 [Planctomycetaceae bacterium]